MDSVASVGDVAIDIVASRVRQVVVNFIILVVWIMLFLCFESFVKKIVTKK